MADKKAIQLSKLTFVELKDKVKEVENFKNFNRFEITKTLLKAGNKPLPAKAANPRTVKPEIAAITVKLAETTGRKNRRKLRRAKARLKRTTRQYL
ncbi:MAG: hypothetical protein AMR96_00745 [Candidatus Adiutrix intracellularis]|jgi:hypothetical protein|nr:MAG: hypothetical protein AMR96_00745 [Candidatus Adiutrix intracellularis]MDR2827236.1 hypothetical protein [Candidatus Adiutrix intracellularis]